MASIPQERLAKLAAALGLAQEGNAPWYFYQTGYSPSVEHRCAAQIELFPAWLPMVPGLWVLRSGGNYWQWSGVRLTEGIEDPDKGFERIWSLMRERLYE